MVMTSSNKVEHSKQLEKFDDAYYKVVCVAETLKTANNHPVACLNRPSSRQAPHIFWRNHRLDLINVERFTYFKSSLSGEPLTRIHSLLMTSDNFNIA
ncbi:hypothetical protein PR048_031211 [Dryococelus australis]|uniref:Uncharacterized protein n=1 Tax=Dryococelus australis TaxID=614101 RepID=A0ABQ9G4L7_9NEOP|nr:hypothetical protein PR048_031211 [Dryococelus australis]